MADAHLFASARYAHGLAGCDAVVAVPEWGSHLVRRPIAEGGFDAMGLYPLQVFGRGSDIGAGLQRLTTEGFVSAAMVPDPLLSAAGELARHFEVCRPFKAHYLIDPAAGTFSPSKHHRDRIRRGQRRCEVRQVVLAEHLDAWTELYAGLIARHSVTGAAAFSQDYFSMLAGEPAVAAFAAFVDGACAGMTLWFAAQGVVYNHLTAANAAGYANGANFALYGAAIEHFEGHGVVNLGGGAGLSDSDDGLVAFKRGFANSEVTAHICGAVLDATRYAELSAGRGGHAYFPAYRGPRTVARAA
jgi:hypothetical protein